MIGLTLGDATTSSIPATGSVNVVYAQQAALTSIHVEWSYVGEDEDTNIYFLIYLNGRLLQRLPGSARDTDLIATTFDTQDVQVIPWRRDMPIQSDMYGSLQALRGHLEWARPADTDVVGYDIYSSTAELGTYTLYAEHRETSLPTGLINFDAGDSTLELNGSYSILDGHTNTQFFVNILDDSTVEITNDKDATVITSAYVDNVPFVPMSGVIMTISGTSPRSGEAEFTLGVQPYFDTDALVEGTTWFKVQPVDESGNLGALSSAVPITIALPPTPVTDMEMIGVFYITDVVPRITLTQSTSPDATDVLIYTNLDTASMTLLDDVFFDVPYMEFAAEPGETVNFLPLNPAEVVQLNGTFKVVARALDSSGYDDGTSVVYEIEIPVLLEYPQPHTIVATPTAGGGVDLEWYTSEELEFGATWRIFGDIATAYDDASTTAIEDGIFFKYSASLPAVNVGVQGTYTIEIYARDGGGNTGPRGSIQVTTDSTAPSGITNLTGTPF